MDENSFLKEKLLDDIQRKAHKTLLEQHLNPRLECIIPGYTNVIFVCDTESKGYWNFDYKYWRGYVVGKTICAFVRLNEWKEREYHLIFFKELSELLEMTNDKMEYIFNDANNEYLNRWEILEKDFGSKNTMK